MYNNLLRKRISPYVFFDKVKIPLQIINISDSYNSFASNLLIDDVMDEVEKANINITEYDKCISFGISESYVDKGFFKFLINKKDIKTLDIKLILVAGYVYIFHKDGFKIDSISLLIKDNDINIIENTNNTTIDDYGKNLILNSRDNIFTDIGVQLNGSYIRINPGENLFDVFENNKIIEWQDYIFNMEMKSMYLYNDITGFSDDLSGITMEPLFIKNDSNNVLILLVNKGVEEWNNNPLKNNGYFLYDHISLALKFKVLRDFYISDLKGWIPRQIVDIADEFESDRELLLYLRDFNYDLYISLMMERFRTNYFFPRDKIVFTDKLDYLTGIIQSDYNIRNKSKYITVLFHNHRKYIPEVYFNGVRYNGYKLVEKLEDNTRIAIRVDSFMEYYNLSDESEVTHVYIVLRREDFLEYHYHNIYVDYNGVVPIGKSFFKIHNPTVYDNGYRIKSTDYSFNNILPYGLVVAFPKRSFTTHNLVVTGYPKDNIVRKELKLKVANFTNEDEVDFLVNATPNKYIYKSLFYTEYIDYRYKIYVGPYLLMMDVDYFILSSNLIVFNNTIYKYKDDIDNDYIKITIELDEPFEPYESYAKKSSYLYKLTKDANFRALMSHISGLMSGDTRISDTRAYLDCPNVYSDNVYKTHIFLTKYLSSEVTLDGTADIYGKGFFNMINSEFPEFILTDDDGNNYIEFDTKYPSDDVIPRAVELPEEYPLNVLVSEDIIAKRKLLALNLDNTKNNYNNELNNQFFSKDFYKEGIDMNFIQEDVMYNPNIPFDAIYDTSTILDDTYTEIALRSLFVNFKIYDD